MIPISGKLGAAPRGALIGAVVFGLIGAIDWPKPLVIRWEINGIQQPIGPIGRAIGGAICGALVGAIAGGPVARLIARWREGRPVSDPAHQSPGDRVICGFWTRLEAFFLDSLALSCVWFVLAEGPIATTTVNGLTSKIGPLWSFGRWDCLLEFCVFLVYFGVLNSSIAGGQTIFKRIMKIQVIDRSGHCISPGRSFLRSAVLLPPFFFMVRLVKPPVNENAIPSYVAFACFGLFSAIVYLYVVNLRTRQSLHDLIVGTFVAQTTPPVKLSAQFGTLT